MNISNFPGEVPDGNEEHAIGKWTKGYPCYKVACDLAGLFTAVEWKVELVSN